MTDRFLAIGIHIQWYPSKEVVWTLKTCSDAQSVVIRNQNLKSRTRRKQLILLQINKFIMISWYDFKLYQSYAHGNRLSRQLLTEVALDSPRTWTGRHVGRKRNEKGYKCRHPMRIPWRQIRDHNPGNKMLCAEECIGRLLSSETWFSVLISLVPELPVDTVAACLTEKVVDCQVAEEADDQLAWK